MKWNRSSILDNMREQANLRLTQKYNWKRNPSRVLQRIQDRFSGLKSPGFALNAGMQVSHELDLGVDDSGRDVSLVLKAYADYLLNRGVELHTLLVLGSRAKGRSRPESDVDVLIIASGLPGKSSAELTTLAQKIMGIRRSLLLAGLHAPRGIQPSGCCSKEEFLLWLRRFKILAWDAICYSKEIYDDGFWKYALKISNEIKDKYGLDGEELRKILWVL